MWRSVFLHEFIDHRIGNFQAVAGSATSSSFALAPAPDPVAGLNSVSITPGSGFEYLLEQPLQQVIGVSWRVRFLRPTGAHAQLFTIAWLGGGPLLELSPSPLPLPDGSGTPTKTVLFFGGVHKDLGLIVLPANRVVDVRFDWHTTGQARLVLDGQLTAYHNAVSPGASFTADRVSFGMPGSQPPSTQPLYRIARVFVRALVRTDSLSQFSRLLPPVKASTADVNRCQQRVLSNLMQVTERLRQFMTSAHQALSQPWTQEGGPAAGPFRPAATKAHKLAMASVTALASMLRTGDFSAPDSFLDPFTEFLRILHATLPAQFEALADELANIDVVPDSCRQELEPTRRQNEDAFAPVVALLSAAADRLRQVAGGN